jgi:hypothetical protein
MCNPPCYFGKVFEAKYDEQGMRKFFLRKSVANLRREYTDNIKKEYNLCGKKGEICAWKVMYKGGFYY